MRILKVCYKYDDEIGIDVKRGGGGEQTAILKSLK